MRIVALNLLTNRLAEQRAFYADALGLHLVEERDDAFTVQAGATRLTFQQDPEGKTSFYHFAFNIPENQLAQGKAWIAQRATLLTLDGEDEFATETWDSHQIYFTDPAGNIGELIARHTLHNGATGDFGPRSILSVSEIGLPVDDVPATVTRLCDALGVATYQEESDTFTPVGDEEGLFIVVQRPRPWFPTDRVATAHDINVVVRGTTASLFQVSGFPYRITAVS